MPAGMFLRAGFGSEERMRRAFQRRLKALLLDPRAFIVLDVGGDDLGPFLDEEIDSSPADARCGARDYRDFTV